MTSQPTENNPGSNQKTSPQTVVTTLIWGQLGRVAEVSLSFVFSVVVVRQLSTQEFGVYSVIVNLVIVAYLFTNMGMSDALARYLPLAKSAPTAYHLGLLKGFLIGRTVLSLAGGILFWLLSSFLINNLNVSLTSTLLGLAAALLLATSLLDLLTNYYIAAFRFKELVLIRAFAQFLNIAVMLIWFWLSSPDIAILLTITTASNFLGCLYCLWRLPFFALVKDNSLKTANFLRNFWQSDRQSEAPLKEIYKYSFSLWLINLTTFSLGGTIDVLIISLVLNDPSQVAYYALATVITVRLYSLILGWSSSISSVIATVYVEKGRAGLVRYFLYYYKLNLLGFLGVSGYLLANSYSLIVVIFGEKYAPSVSILSCVLAGWIVNSFLGAGICYYFSNTLGKQKKVLYWRTLLGSFNIGLAVILCYQFGIVGVALATAISISAVSLVEFILIRELVEKMPFGFMAKMAGVVAAASFVAYFTTAASFTGLAVSFGAYLLVLCSLLWLSKPLASSDKELLLNWRPRLSGLLKYL